MTAGSFVRSVFTTNGEREREKRDERTMATRAKSVTNHRTTSLTSIESERNYNNNNKLLHVFFSASLPILFPTHLLLLATAFHSSRRPEMETNFPNERTNEPKFFFFSCKKNFLSFLLGKCQPTKQNQVWGKVIYLIFPFSLSFI